MHGDGRLRIRIEYAGAQTVPRQRSLQPTSPYSCPSTIEGQDTLPIVWAGHLLGAPLTLSLLLPNRPHEH
ncbi:hypothetical protein V2G26_016889 [Clonostachys chloroleuca]